MEKGCQHEHDNHMLDMTGKGTRVGDNLRYVVPVIFSLDGLHILLKLTFPANEPNVVFRRLDVDAIREQNRQIFGCHFLKYAGVHAIR